MRKKSGVAGLVGGWLNCLGVLLPLKKKLNERFRVEKIKCSERSFYCENVIQPAVCFDQLLGAALTRKLVEILF